jgi:hypothetical protein
VPAAKPVIVVLEPVPVVVTPSGLRVKVQVPVLGKPVNTILPVATVQVGCVSVPTEGALGLPVLAVMTIFAVAEDSQPVLFATKKA